MESENLSSTYATKKMSEEIEIKVQGSPREELIKTAVNFLVSPMVQQSPASQKEAFLKKKGLTAEEIRIAFEKSNSSAITIPSQYSNHLSMSNHVIPAGISWFQRFKETLHTLMLLVGATYGLYYLYKKIIEPFLFKRDKKPKSAGISIHNLNKSLEKSVGDLKNDMAKVQCELERISAIQNDSHNQLKLMSEVKSEIATVKGILLSRHQFSSVNLSGPSIPAWQMTQSSHKEDKGILEHDDGEHNSGSSETEIAANSNSNGESQGSDSSLEMIKEVDN